MDSVTHILIGAAIGEAVVGKKIGRKGMLIGAIAKSFPDIDVFFTSLADQRSYLHIHRGYTHSLLMQAWYLFPLSYICYLLFKKKTTFIQWVLLWAVCLFGHSLMDTCTNYGTRLFLPFSSHPYSFNTIAILDLFLTLPLLIIVAISIFSKNNTKLRITTSRLAIVYTACYCIMAFINKAIADTHFKSQIKQQEISYKHYLSNPTILNNFLWYGIAVNDSTISVGEYSLFKPQHKIQFYTYDRQLALLQNCADTADISLLKWFSGPYYFVQQRGDTLLYFNIKFGRTDMQKNDAEGTFMFYYKIYKNKDGKWQLGWQEPNASNFSFKDGCVDIWNRIF